MMEMWFMPLLLFALQLGYSEGQTTDELEGVRLVDGTYGAHMGRVEVLYNDTWGTVCSNGWDYLAARATCRSLGYVTTICAVQESAVFGRGNETAPIWMAGLDCGGGETSLGDCSFRGWGIHSCQHSDDVGTVCADPSAVGLITNLTQTLSSAFTATIAWKAAPPPAGVVYLRFRIEVDSISRPFFHYTDDLTMRDFEYVILSLEVNSSYSVRVRPDVRYAICPTSYLFGTFTDYVPITTNEEFVPSTIQVRLVSPIPGLDFMGRLEVLYDGTWGTVCDDTFQSRGADVACRMANYTDAICYVREAGMGQGTGPIWLDNVNCRTGHDVLEDCDHNGWGVNNCQHNADIGLICRPNDPAYTAAIAGVSVLSVAASSITVQWQPFAFPTGVSTAVYRVRYRMAGQTSVESMEFSGNDLSGTVTNLEFDQTYSINVRAEYGFLFCSQRILGELSNSVTATTVEMAPSGPPTAFYVRVLNSSAIEAEWELPLASQRNGVVRGYLLFVQPQDGTVELQHNITGGDSTQLIVGGLAADKAYTCSVLAYTVEEGPRSVYLTVVTFAEDFVPLIGYFGENGDGYDRSTHFLNETSVSVHCGSGLSDVELHWLFADGSPIGTSSRNIYEGRHDNGTTTLYITNQLTLSYCDAGTFVCMANRSGYVQEREFTLMIGLSPPPPSAPYLLQSGSTWLTIGWDEPECDGGHKVTAFNILYREQDDNLVTSNRRIYHIEPSLRNYTLRNLQPETQYSVSLQALSAQFHTSPYTFGRIVTTLPEAPTPPRDVAVRLASVSVVEVSWRAPAVPNGIITQYTVYGTPRDLYFQNGVVIIPEHIQQSVAGHIGTVNITIPGHLTAVVYKFQVSASITVGGQLNEGTPSTVTPESTVLLPNPLSTAVPRTVLVESITNASVSLQWSYPEGAFAPIVAFQVKYSGHVEWRTSSGRLLMFEDAGNRSTQSTQLTVAPLVPDTDYRFRVSALTQSGQGQEVIVMATTKMLFGEGTKKVAYFQLRILEIEDCFDWQERQSEVIPAIKSAVLAQLNAMCSCALTPAHITDEVLSCRAEAVHQMVYRGRILGSDSYSATGLVSLLQSWIQGGAAALTIDAARLQLDTTCDATLDNGDSPDCPTAVLPTPSSPPVVCPPYFTDQTSTVTGERAAELSGGEIGGLIVGIVIALLLLVFIALLLVVLVKVVQPRLPFRHKELEGEEAMVEPSERSQDNPVFDPIKPDPADL